LLDYFYDYSSGELKSTFQNERVTKYVAKNPVKKLKQNITQVKETLLNSLTL